MPTSTLAWTLAERVTRDRAPPEPGSWPPDEGRLAQETEVLSSHEIHCFMTQWWHPRRVKLGRCKIRPRACPEASLGRRCVGAKRGESGCPGTENGSGTHPRRAGGGQSRRRGTRGGRSSESRSWAVPEEESWAGGCGLLVQALGKWETDHRNQVLVAEMPFPNAARRENGTRTARCCPWSLCFFCFADLVFCVLLLCG